MENIPRFAVTYGRTDFFAEEGLETLLIATKEEVKQLALQFINVIPDDLDSYKEDIAKWNGKSRFIITHQDDDTFYFSVIPFAAKVATKAEMAKFHSFVKEFDHSDF